MRAKQAELLKRAKAGEAEALNRLILLVEADLLRFVSRKVPTREDAADVCQQVLLRATLKLDTYHERATFATWLIAIAKRAVADFYRANRRSIAVRVRDWETGVVELGHPLLTDGTDVRKRCHLCERVEHCVACILATLPLRQQLAVILSDIYGFQDREASMMMGEKLGIIRHLLAKARTTLDSVSGSTCALVRKDGNSSQCAVGKDKPPAQRFRPQSGAPRKTKNLSTQTDLVLLRRQLLRNLAILQREM